MTKKGVIPVYEKKQGMYSENNDTNKYSFLGMHDLLILKKPSVTTTLVNLQSTSSLSKFSKVVVTPRKALLYYVFNWSRITRSTTELFGHLSLAW